MGSYPLEIMLRRVNHFVVTAIIEVSELVSVLKKLKRLDIPHRFTHAVNHIDVRTDHVELGKLCGLVVLVKLLEVMDELVLLQHFQVFLVEGVLCETLDGKNVFHRRFGFQAHVDVVAKYEFVPDRYHVTRDAVVSGCDSCGFDQFGFDRTEDITTNVIQLSHSGAKFIRMASQSIANDFVR